MKLKKIEEMQLKGIKKEGILMLHGFTGNPNQFRKLAKDLNMEGYTVHVPVYKGHGGEPEEIVGTSVEEWYKGAKEGYEKLKDSGCEKIHIVGVSVGGVFGLKLAEEKEVDKLVTISTPFKKVTQKDLKKRIREYAYVYKKMQGIDEKEIEKETKKLEKEIKKITEELNEFVVDVIKGKQEIKSKLVVMQGMKDEKLYVDSFSKIKKELKKNIQKVLAFEESDHLLIIGKEKEQVRNEIMAIFKG